MKNLLVAAAATLAVYLPSVYAQDKGKSDFTHNAEMRIRDTFEQNQSGSSNLKPAHHNGIDQRFKLGLGFKANEKFGLTTTLIESGSWGQRQGDTYVGDRHYTYGGNPTEENMLYVNEAYASWMISENLTTKWGRQNFAFGDGTVMSVNDWEIHPYSFDGVTAQYEIEWGKFQFFAFKYRDLYTSFYGTTMPTPTPAATSDPQHDAYGVVFDLKTTPEWLKAVNLHVIQDTADGIYGGTGDNAQTSTANISALRYGVMAAFGFNAFDLRANYEMVSGKDSIAAANGAVAQDKTLAENMMQIEGGFTLPSFMSSRWFLRYHQDSGTSAADQTAGNKDATYDPYFYDRHSAAGNMELVGWGNLTDISLGWTLKPLDNLDVGASYHMFSKTNAEDNVNSGTYGRWLFATPQTLAAGQSASSAIGNEIDVWAEHKYEGGLSMLANIGQFMPGSALKNLAANKGDTVTQVMVQGRLTF